MRRITFLIAFAILITNNIIGQTYVTTNAINEDFNAGTSGTWGFTASGGGTVFTNSGGVLNVLFQSPTGTATKTLSPTLNAGDDNKIYIEFDWNVGTPGRTNNTAVLFFRDASGRKIFGMLGYRLTGNSLRLLNLNTTYTTYDDASLKFGTFALGANIHISATINFSTKKVETITASLVSTPTTSITATDLSFLDTNATNLADLYIDWFRGGSGNHNYLFDNFLIYTKKLSAGKADVTINYLDTDGNGIKAARTAQQQDVGLFYSATDDDKSSVKTSTNYYVYNSTATAAGVTSGTGDTVNVKSNGSTINLKFSKYNRIDGNYTWTGSVSSNWNETENNFTTDGINSTGVQFDNNQNFDASSTVKSIILNSNLNTGTSSINVTADGYSFTGTGILKGSGTFNINPGAGNSTTLNITNSLASGLNLISGIANVTSDASASKYSIQDGATLKVNTGVAFSKQITGSGTANLQATSNIPYNLTVTGLSGLNIELQNAGAISGTNWSDYFDGSFSSGTQVNVSIKSGLTSAGFATTDAALTNTNINLNDGVRLFRFTNQGASSGGTSTIIVGSLSGTSGSSLEGGIVDASNRILAYEIGALNTNTIFNGVIKNYGTVTTAPLYIYKKGTGTWTLTGTSTYSPGLFNVDAGKVVLTGSLTGTSVPVTVANGATLSGTGTIAGPTTINGTLEGSLNFGSSLTLAGTTNITVNGFGATQYDSITVAGALTNGGNLNITVSGAAPALGSTIKLIKAGTITGAFANVTTPANYLYNQSTGVLYYGTYTNVSNTKAESLQVYPTMTTGVININGKDASRAEIFSIAGQTVKQVNNLSATNSVNISDLSNGAYLVKVQFADGSAKTQRILLQK